PRQASDPRRRPVGPLPPSKSLTGPAPPGARPARRGRWPRHCTADRLPQLETLALDRIARRVRRRPAFGRTQPAAPFANMALNRARPNARRAHRRMTMSKKTLKLILAGVVVAGAFGVLALRAARATPPRGVTNT